ncbi:MAG: NBR1-Ig-like domain-containing protein [Chloroflexota bacterium]|nr:MAG: hypothetical protein DLM70_08650 [Chloroflexota bacterium]
MAGGGLAASYAISGQLTSASPGQTASYQITVTNKGTSTWSAGGANPVHLRIAAALSMTTVPKGTLVSDQGYALPADVVPGQSVTLSVSMPMPSSTGAYALIHQMVEEGVVSFSQYIRRDPASRRTCGIQGRYQSSSVPLDGI